MSHCNIKRKKNILLYRIFELSVYIKRNPLGIADKLQPSIPLVPLNSNKLTKLVLAPTNHVPYMFVGRFQCGGSKANGWISRKHTILLSSAAQGSL